MQNGCDALEDLPRQMGAEALGGKLGRSLGAISEIVPFPLAFSYLSIDREIRPSPSRSSVFCVVVGRLASAPANCRLGLDSKSLPGEGAF